MSFLLGMLDRPDDASRATKFAVREVFGIKLIGVRAAARRRAIFELAGMDSAQQATWKSLSVSQREARRVAREVARAREAAQMSKVRTEDGAVLTGAEWVDRSIADGSSEIIAFRQVRACGTRSRIPRVLCRFRCVRMTERSPMHERVWSSTQADSSCFSTNPASCRVFSLKRQVAGPTQCGLRLRHYKKAIIPGLSP